MVVHQTVDLKGIGSSPMGGVHLYLGIQVCIIQNCIKVICKFAGADKWLSTA